VPNSGVVRCRDMTTFTDDEAQLEGVEIPHGPITPSAATSGRRRG